MPGVGVPTPGPWKKPLRLNAVLFMALVISAYLCKFLISEGVVASQRCMASEHYFLLVALVFFLLVVVWLHDFSAKPRTSKGH